MLLALCSDGAGAERPGEQSDVEPHERRDRPGAAKKKVEREDEIDEADGEQNPEQHFGRERRAGPQHLIEQNVVSGRHGVTILARGARSRNSAFMPRAFSKDEIEEFFARLKKHIPEPKTELQ